MAYSESNGHVMMSRDPERSRLWPQ